MNIFVPLGIIASLFQIIILREFNFSVAKNELAFILAAGFWIISCSLGSAVKISQKRFRGFLPALLSLVFFFSISLIHLAKFFSGLLYYETASPGLTVFLSILLICPTAFIIGAAFRNLVDIYNENENKKQYAAFFAYEAAGFFIGGLVFSFFLSSYSNPLIFSILPLLLIPGIKEPGKKIKSGVVIAAFSVFSLFSFEPLLKKELGNAEILFNAGNGYGPVIAILKSDTVSIFSSGSLISTNQDKSSNEEFIHMALSGARPESLKKILYIGAGLSGQLDEIIKHWPDSLTQLQINPLITQISKNGSGLGIDKINFVTDDPRTYLNGCAQKNKYDAILMNMPPPANLALNRYFTKEFFKSVKDCLSADGVFAFSLPSKREILSHQFVVFNSSIINALNAVFPHSFLIPSDSMVVIASGQKITGDYLLKNFSESQIKNSYFNVFRFKDYLSDSMRNYTLAKLDKNIAPNSDLFPYGFLSYLILEQAKFTPGLKINFPQIRLVVFILLATLAALAIFLSCFSKKNLIFCDTVLSGFNSISLVSLIYVLFQIYCGSLFLKLGIIIALFMGGLSLGTFLIDRVKRSEKWIAGIFLGWTALSLALMFGLKALRGFDKAEFVFYFLNLTCGFLTGAIYPCLADNLIKEGVPTKKITRAIYSLDLAGAFLGTIFTGILLIPFLGIPACLLALSFLNLIFFLRNFTPNPRFRKP